MSPPSLHGWLRYLSCCLPLFVLKDFTLHNCELYEINFLLADFVVTHFLVAKLLYNSLCLSARTSVINAKDVKMVPTASMSDTRPKKLE